jgi:UDP-glucose 4-epimerase
MHPSYNDDAYGLSKWVCEQQADSLVRRFGGLSIVSLRLPWVTSDRSLVEKSYADPVKAAAGLGAFVDLSATARAFLLALEATVVGHEIFYIVAPETLASIPSIELVSKYFPDTPIRGDLDGFRSLFDCAKAKLKLNWTHDTISTT